LNARFQAVLVGFASLYPPYPLNECAAMPYNRGLENVSGSEPMKREFSVIIEQDSEGNYVASVPALRGCHTQAKSLDEVMVRIREAIELCLEVQGEDVEELDFVGVQKVVLAR
jgi:predicted RNase H-like HicB family nuclease